MKFGEVYTVSLGIRDDKGRQIGCDYWISRDDDNPEYPDQVTFGSHVQPTRDGKPHGKPMVSDGRLYPIGATIACENMIDNYRVVCENRYT